MYDAGKYIIRKKVVCFDASYAELRTDYGFADAFISHVWGESAYVTLQSIRKLKDSQRQNGSVVGNVPFRVWFCTTCNNQSRVKEELGADVHHSPFAQVLRSPACQKVAMISPFKALRRKWCNFEFCIAMESEKPVLLVTSEGTVQEGEVAPKTLNELSKVVSDFKCETATCHNKDDEALINEAVDRIGGYIALDRTLRKTFMQAIDEAHKFTAEAQLRISVVGEPALQSITKLHIAQSHSLHNIIKSQSSPACQSTSTAATVEACPCGCGFQVTWHDSHCCGTCRDTSGDKHGPRCDKVCVKDGESSAAVKVFL